MKKITLPLTLTLLLSSPLAFGDLDPGVDIEDKNNHAEEHFVGKKKVTEDVDSRYEAHRAHFARLDLNHNEIITRKEFLSVWETHFHNLDKNNDEVLNETHEVNIPALNKMDKNNDKVVTKEEFLSLYSGNFDFLDTDNDNELDFSEYLRPFRHAE